MEQLFMRACGIETYWMREKGDFPSPPPGHFGAGDKISSGGGDGSVMISVLVKMYHRSKSQKTESIVQFVLWILWQIDYISKS